MDLFNKIVDLFNKFVAFSNKIVDLFDKIVDLLFERGVVPHLENPPGYGPDLCMAYGKILQASYIASVSIRYYYCI